MEDAFLERLYARRRFGMRPGLATMQALMERLDHPERRLAAVHVAGTNGKGSVTALVAEVLSAAGLRVGRFTSPHLLRFRERFFADGAPVDTATLAEAAADVEAAALDLERTGGEPATFFECATAMAFDVFRRRGIRLAVVETGLGGRLDATNVLMPLVSVITRIGLDHCEQLGNSLEAIAREKAGIVKAGRPVVCGAMPDEAQAAIRQAAAAQGCVFIDAAGAISLSSMSAGIDGLAVRLSTPSRDLGRIRTPLAGSYQCENLATATAALEAVAEALRQTVPDDAFRTGFGRVCWPGRFQLAVRSPPVIVDGAHNPDGAAALREALHRLKFRGPVGLVTGLCEDKDAAGFLRILSGVANRVWTVPVPSARSLPAASTAGLARAAGAKQVAACELSPALAAARAWAEDDRGLVLVCGSLFLAGQALELLGAYPWPLEDAGRAADANERLKMKQPSPSEPGNSGKRPSLPS